MALPTRAGSAIFFQVKRIEDPIGLLPAKLILGINKRGAHFFRPVRQHASSKSRLLGSFLC